MRVSVLLNLLFPAAIWCSPFPPQTIELSAGYGALIFGGTAPCTGTVISDQTSVSGSCGYSYTDRSGQLSNLNYQFSAISGIGGSSIGIGVSWLPTPIDYPAVDNPILLNPSFGLGGNTLYAGTRSTVYTYVMVFGAPMRFTLRSNLSVSGGRFDPPFGGGARMEFFAQLVAGGGLCTLGWVNSQAGDGTFGGTCATAAILDLVPGVPYPIVFDMRASASIRAGMGGVFTIDPNVGISSLSLTDDQGNELDLGSFLAPVDGLRFTPNGIVAADIPEPATLASSLLAIALALVARAAKS